MAHGNRGFWEVCQLTVVPLRAAQYTLILHASKAMPKQCVDYLSGKVKPRRTVGVRMPGDAICQVPPAAHAHWVLQVSEQQ